MTETVFLANALCLPSADLQALVQGKMVTVMPWNFLSPGQSFALYSEGENNTYARFWARCELCKSIDNPKLLNALSNLTIWRKQLLESKLLQRGFLFLAYLRAYEIPQPIQVLTQAKGEFLPLDEPTMVLASSPILSEIVFRNYVRKLDEIRPSVHPELEEFQNIVSQFISINPAAKLLDEDIRALLGWSTDSKEIQFNSDMQWITSIVSLGNRSKELDEGKSNYQAGTDFENIVQRSLDFLGFTVDQAYKGGAGGLDLFCSSPYPLVGECKAGKKIPSGTTEELIKLGGMRLGTNRFLASAKLIIGPGNPTPDVLTAAAEWKVSIINPMSLQKLVELKAKYPGSIDLIELKKYLEPGQIDHKIDEYVEKVLGEIRLRSHITQILKEYLEKFKAIDVDVNTLFGVYCGSNPPQVLTPQAFYKILIELSSPLTGYLGRREGSDRFYFLRDLLVD
jgi:hypothetical protein